jgi:hypothetical protein
MHAIAFLRGTERVLHVITTNTLHFITTTLALCRTIGDGMNSPACAQYLLLVHNHAAFPVLLVTS